MATKATDSSTITMVQNTSSKIVKSNHLKLKLPMLQPVVKWDRLIPGHRKIDDIGIGRVNSGHRKGDLYHHLEHIFIL